MMNIDFAKFNKNSDVDKIKWHCVICDEVYHPSYQTHKCKKGAETRFNAGKKAAETRIENNGYWFLELTFCAALDECRAMYNSRI